MTYELYIGDRTFSSWSLRGWLMLEKFGIPFETRMVGLYSGRMAQDLVDLHPARLVPVLKTPEGDVIGETIAMAETLNERHPDAGFWPQERSARSRARWICAEMASGFPVLRGSCPMQLQHVQKGFTVQPDLQNELDRLEVLWAFAREKAEDGGPWLFGRYSLADVFFAPVAARIVGYDLPVSAFARTYCTTVISDPAFKSWRTKGLETVYDPFPYDMGLATQSWPV